MEKVAAFVGKFGKIFKTEITVGEKVITGTGFLISNKHIITDSTISGRDIKGKAIFNFEKDENNEIKETRSFDIKTDGLFIRNEELNFTICEIDKESLFEKMDFINIFEKHYDRETENLFSIGHPKGGTLVFAKLTREKISDEKYIYYDNSTNSSGSPIFDEKGNIIAIHYGIHYSKFLCFTIKSKFFGIKINAIANSLSNEQIEIIKNSK